MSSVQNDRKDASLITECGMSMKPTNQVRAIKQPSSFADYHNLPEPGRYGRCRLKILKKTTKI